MTIRGSAIQSTSIACLSQTTLYNLLLMVCIARIAQSVADFALLRKSWPHAAMEPKRFTISYLMDSPVRLDFVVIPSK